MVGQIPLSPLLLFLTPSHAVTFASCLTSSPPLFFACQFYTCANNEARGEDVGQARAVDKKTMEAWLGHPHHYVFGNEGDFEEKVRAR